jgi:hypothetical protein
MVQPPLVPQNNQNNWEELYGQGGSRTNTSGGSTTVGSGNIRIGNKSYPVGQAYDLFSESQDENVRREILQYIQAFNPGYSPKNTPAANSAWNKILDSYSLGENRKKEFSTWFNEEVTLNQDMLGLGDGTTTLIQPSITTREDAYDYFNSLMRDYVGMDADAKDFERYFKALNKLEKTKVSKQKTVRTGSTTTQIVTPGVTNEDREELALDFVSKYIDTKGIENAGGAIGANLRDIRRLAADYNVSLSDAEVRQYALNGLRDKTSIETVRTKIQNTAKAMYQNLSPFIDQGLTVKDIASQYINRMANVLEINPETVKLDNRYVQNALTTLPNFTDFNKMLRNSPQWEYTNNAREEAASYANKILQDFGLR